MKSHSLSRSLTNRWSGVALPAAWEWLPMACSFAVGPVAVRRRDQGASQAVQRVAARPQPMDSSHSANVATNIPATGCGRFIGFPLLTTTGSAHTADNCTFRRIRQDMQRGRNVAGSSAARTAELDEPARPYCLRVCPRAQAIGCPIVDTLGKRGRRTPSLFIRMASERRYQGASAAALNVCPVPGPGSSCPYGWACACAGDR